MKNINELNDSNFAAEISRATLPVLVDFYAPWCGPCRMLAPALESLANQLDGEVQFAKVNVDEAPGVAGQYNIAGVPTLKLFKNGETVDTVVGFISPHQLQTWLKGAILGIAA